MWDRDCSETNFGVCCDVKGPNTTFVLTDRGMTWTEAQSYCREHHTDLASVRNLMEDQQLKEMAATAGSPAWIGLSRDSWKWSDGSTYSFRHWQESEPNYKSRKVCVAAAFHDSGKWYDDNCGKTRHFICYKDVPVSMQVIKVRVEKPNGVDLNDQAFLDDMLVEAKKNLRAQGLDDNVQLAWRKQPDGQVFHKEEEKKKRNEL
ncbi:Aggrecan core protein [Dissostichus eleginoides]|uniref:Aggrecan core protein n=1 Tax=Dissostichus eleginoides TaxID=100907 RepID=A0AAD9CA92_DISEL|nr:Aggrecan core protein [Dissostichus eleginoides]